MASEAASKGHGRRPVFSDDALARASGYSYARRVQTRRGAQDLVYRMFAIAVIEQYCEAFPEKAGTLGWLLRPKQRYTLLTELGRIARPKSDADGALGWNPADVERMIQAALEIAVVRPTTKKGVAMLKTARTGARSEGANSSP